METEIQSLKGSFFNDKSTGRNDERVCKKPEVHLNRRYNGSDEGYVQRRSPAGYGM